MNLTKQVTSIQISRVLNEKGIRNKSKHIWVFFAIAKKWDLQEKKERHFIPGAVPAYTLSELGEMFPFGDFSMQPVIKISNDCWTVPKNDNHKVSFETEVDARAFYLIRMLEKGDVSVDQINGVTVKSKVVLTAQEDIAQDEAESLQKSPPE
jgi:hypothetical protein